jgi:glutathione S-transferase
MWNRRMELVLFAHIGRYFQHTSEIFKTRIKQMPEVAEVAREAALAQMGMIDGLIAGRRFIAGERYTIADITAMVALGLGAVVGPTVDSGLANLTRW